MRYTLPGLHILQIKRNAAHAHVELGNIFKSEMYALHGQKVFGFGQRKRHELYVFGDAVVQPTPVVDYLVNNPGSRRPAYHQNNIRSFGAELIPEVVECGQKA